MHSNFIHFIPTIAHVWCVTCFIAQTRVENWSPLVRVLCYQLEWNAVVFHNNFLSLNSSYSFCMVVYVKIRVIWYFFPIRCLMYRLCNISCSNDFIQPFIFFYRDRVIKLNLRNITLTGCEVSWILCFHCVRMKNWFSLFDDWRESNILLLVICINSQGFWQEKLFCYESQKSTRKEIRNQKSLILCNTCCYSNIFTPNLNMWRFRIFYLILESFWKLKKSKIYFFYLGFPQQQTFLPSQNLTFLWFKFLIN